MKIFLVHNFKDGSTLSVPLLNMESSDNKDLFNSIIAAKMDCYPIEFTAADGSIIIRNYRDVRSVEIVFIE